VAITLRKLTLEVVMLAIRLPQFIEKRLEKIAQQTGRTKTYYVREAILEHLEEIEDLYLAEGALERTELSQSAEPPSLVNTVSSRTCSGSNPRPTVRLMAILQPDFDPRVAR
jgi:RHH-type transcriptional regulator, rel operon repressor / antitoxin RelB